MTSNIPPRIITVRAIAKEYYALPYGALIDKPDELLRVADIKSLKHRQHPHEEHRVYISRKALKHVVQQRKSELAKNHSSEADILLKICFAIEQIPEIIVNFDKYEYEHNPQKYFYTKHYPGQPSIRILCESSKQHKKALEICSTHFTRIKKDK